MRSIREAMKAFIGVDTNIVDYLVRAKTEGYDPKTDPDPVLATEKVAAYRIFLCADALAVGPTVNGEIEKTADPAFRYQLITFRDDHLVELNTDGAKAERRAEFFHQYHTGEKNWRDCLVVAEAEIGGLQVLLTFDFGLRKRLYGKAGSLRLKAPSEYWAEMSITRGQQLRWAPAQTNPLYAAKWWPWE